MNWFQRLALPVLCPSLVDLLSRQHKQLVKLRASERGLQGELDDHEERFELLAESHQACLDQLLSLVCRGDDGAWVTVFDADTRLPSEAGNYLSDLVARA